MKKTLLLSLLSSILAIAIIIAGCTKEGPQGPAGENGINGTDGTASCGQCHNMSEDIFAKVIQWEASTHATGGNFERNTTSCAPCHTSEGFRERILTGEQTTTEDISNPTPPNCYTCHGIHETYTAADWSLRALEPVALWQSGEISDQGKGNLCAQCHQMRVVSPMPDPIAGGTINIGNYRWGGHHGPQANIIAGAGAYEVGTGYANSAHTELVTDGCVTCHMAEPYGTQAGGHQMGIEYEYHGNIELNLQGCLACHPDEDALIILMEATKEDIETLLADLKSVLETQGILDENGYINEGTWSADQAGAYLNYITVLEDRSGGAHNFAYARTLLVNSIASLN